MSEFEDLNETISQLRDEQTDRPLDPGDLSADPFEQFAVWLEAALETHKGWPNAMTLATADADGRPSARIVLLKGVDHSGFTFFTNYSSRKGRELTDNPFAALVFYWPLLGRQVRVTGSVTQVSAAESDAYFATRPRDSQLGAWASQQSSPVAGHEELEAALEDAARRFPDDVPRPGNWGGFRLFPDAFEFWKSRPNRLHDRFLYEPDGLEWSLTRLSP